MIETFLNSGEEVNKPMSFEQVLLTSPSSKPYGAGGAEPPLTSTSITKLLTILLNFIFNRNL